MSIRHEVDELRRSAGLAGGGCVVCRQAPPVTRLRGLPPSPALTGDEPPEGAGVCPVCGYDRTLIVQFVLVDGEPSQESL